MTIPLTTDWSKMRYIMLFIFAIFVLLASRTAAELTTSGKQKRQLFRENLLPEVGGKIPESAFYKDRLALNRLNQNGFYSPDGVHLDQRPHLYNVKHRHMTLKITVPPNNYLVAPEGRYHTNGVIETSYIIRAPVSVNVAPTFRLQSLPLPPIRSLQIIHNTNQNNYKDHHVLSPKKFVQILSQLTPYL